MHKQDGLIPKIGVAIPAYNRISLTLLCLEALHHSTNHLNPIVVVDDGSTDNTTEQIHIHFPDVIVLQGSGNLWWTGATNKAIHYCLEAKCDYVLLLNQDCIVESDTVEKLLDSVEEHPDGIYAAINVYRDFPKRIHWLGTLWKPMRSLPFVYTSESIMVQDMSVNQLSCHPILSDMMGGRGVLIANKVFDRIGFFDERKLPQYGADNDFALRAKSLGIKVWVIPTARVGVKANESVVFSGRGEQSFLSRTNALLWNRRNGEVAKIWWTLAWRHTPWWATLPTYIRMLLVTIKRAWLESK